MDIYDQLLQGVPIPALWPVGFDIPRGEISPEDIPELIHLLFASHPEADKLRGASVAVTAGSREISSISLILRCVVTELRQRGASPFLIPAMGSHGGATAQGQRKVLEHYGITEASIGCPIRSTMETIILTTTSDGLPVHLDKYAYEADCIFPIGRIKPHTDFHGKYESGLVKMLAIGCGKQAGAHACHSMGMANMSESILACAKIILARKTVPFGLAILEDAAHGTFDLELIPGKDILVREAALLETARSLVPRIPFDKVDVLVLEEIGKNISGPGMDPNVTGVSAALGVSAPYIDHIAVLGLSEQTDHNAAGLGLADVTTKQVFDSIDFEKTYPNCMTSHDLHGIKIPAVMPSDRNAVRLAIDAAPIKDKVGCRLVWMENTLHPDRFLVSESLVPEVRRHPKLRLLGQGAVPLFDSQGALTLRPSQRLYTAGG